MNRRQFVRHMALTGATSAAAMAAGFYMWQRQHFVPGFQPKTGISLPSFAQEGLNSQASMAIAHGTDRFATTRAAIEALGGIQRFISKGDVVMLKPNVAFDRPPALAATTHPDSLRVIAQMVLDAGARKIIVADNPINSPAGCFLKSGLQAVASELNLDLMYPEHSAFTNLELEGEILRHWPMFYRPFEKADKVIGIAPCKDHNLCSASMTMKNWYGLLGGRRNQFHQHIHSIISDFALMVKPSLVVLDGMNVLISNGPTGGRLSDVKEMGTVVAGTDMVAVDSYGYTHMLERDVANLEYLHKAHERGLGNMNWKESNWKEVRA
jgi:uncharacterized protein (DUF362 family)